jgi:hypothetical protein
MKRLALLFFVALAALAWGQEVCSPLLDINTCENCAAADEATGPTPGDIPDIPNPDCDGADRCRCVHVYVFSGEVR